MPEADRGVCSSAPMSSFASHLQPVPFSWLALLLASACASEPPSFPSAPRGDSIVVASGPILVLGDTQRTTFGEELLGREQNESGRQRLIEKMAIEERPAFVVHLGDMVSVGDSPEEWSYFDRLMSPLTAHEVDIFPVLGNHDYWGSDVEARRLAARRFPQLGRQSWYSMRHRGLGLVWLDSNLRGHEANRQTGWFDAILRSFERDPELRGVVVFTHHPAYTNGIDRRSDRYVLHELAPRFQSSPKARLFVSGHVHGYERFEFQGRAFVVSGGGGGPRVSYRQGPHRAAFVSDSPGPRPLHYLTLSITETALQVLAKCLPGDGCGSDGVLDEFQLPLSRAECP